MSDSDTSGFGKFVPGFDFLQNLAKGASSSIPQMPNLGNWVAPTLNPEELEKRIDELKAVHFWLEQNSRALAATIQALEVQKMTLATLKGMNFSMGEVADAMKFKPAEAAASAPKQEAKTPAAEKPEKSEKPDAASAALVDPLQLWGSLTQQFQQIATAAIKDATSKTATEAGSKAPAKRAPAKKATAAKAARKKPAAR
jgi:hypothetical protein